MGVPRREPARHRAPEPVRPGQLHGAQPAPLWGDEDHVRELFGDRISEIHAEVRSLPVRFYASAEEFRDYFKANYGPTISVYRSLAAEPDRVAALDRDLVELGRRFEQSSGGSRFASEYLLVTARRR